jgi:hypothetical protein
VGERQTLHRLPDSAVADQAERQTGEASPQHQVRCPDPVLAPADQPVALRDAAEQRQHQRDRQLGSRLGQHVRGIRHDDAAAPARVEVDVVHADGVVRDDPQLRPGGVEQLLVDAVGQHQHQAVAAGDAAHKLLALQRPLRVVQVELERPLELGAHTQREAP